MSPAFDVRPPLYWMHETSGVLVGVIERYLTARETMTMRDISLMRVYLKQWIDSPVWDQNPSQTENGRQKLAYLRLVADSGLVTVSGLQQWIEIATEHGLDPL